MPTIKLIFRESSVTNGEGTVFLRIIHRRMVRQLHTGCRLMSGEWDEKRCAIKPPADNGRADHIASVTTRIKDETDRLNAIINGLERSRKEYTVDDIVERYVSTDTVVGFISFARKLIHETRSLGRHTTADHYASALSSLMRYRGDREIPFDCFDHRLVCGYESYLRGLNLIPNTISYYMRNLRSVYNNAVEQELTTDREPFRRVFTGVEKTVKRSVSVDMIKSLLHLDLGHDPVLGLSRDLFIFSIYTRGMAFIDLAYLKKSNIRNGYLSYRRHKTTRQLNIRLEKQMLEIIDRHCNEGSEYVFPLIKDDKEDHRRQYLNAYKTMSRRLRRLGEMIGMAEVLTFHRARHTWASIAKRNNVPVSIIKEGMGHDSEKTAQIYLDSLDSDDVDNANSAIIGMFSE